MKGKSIQGRKYWADQSSAVGRRPSVEWRIEELVLHGFSPGDRYRIGEAVERELTRLLAEQGVPPSLNELGEVDRLDGGEFKIATGTQAETIGVQVARALYSRLNK